MGKYISKSTLKSHSYLEFMVATFSVLFTHSKTLVDLREYPVFDFFTVSVPCSPIFLTTDGVIPLFTMNQQDEEVDGVEIRPCTVKSCMKVKIYIYIQTTKICSHEGANDFTFCRIYFFHWSTAWWTNKNWLTLVGWLVGCFGLNSPLRQHFSLYRAVS